MLVLLLVSFCSFHLTTAVRVCCSSPGLTAAFCRIWKMSKGQVIGNCCVRSCRLGFFEGVASQFATSTWPDGHEGEILSECE